MVGLPSTARLGLPTPLSSFVGREREVQDVTRALQSTRLLTLTGPGGCGKTRLAHAVATRWPGEVVWVELAALGRGDAVVGAIAQTLGVRPGPSQTEAAAVRTHLGTRAVLLVLDNAEHVIDATTETVQALLAACPAVRLLVTSRHPLEIDGEVDWGVPALRLPVDGEAAADSDAVRLFAARARDVDRAFTVDDDLAPAVVDVCRRLDGMPLAIEFAAARLRALSPEQLAERLDAGLGLTGRPDAATPARQRTMQASIAWSHDLLDADERVLLRRLAVFADGFTLPLAEAVCADAPLTPGRILELLEALTAHSLVTVVARRGVPRFRLLQPVRQFMLARLDAAGESGDLRDRHRDVLLALAEEQRDALRTADQPAAVAILDREELDLAAALDHAVASDPEAALRLCVALDMWWRMRGRIRGRAAALDRALAADDAGPSTARCRALISRAWQHDNERELTHNLALGAEALAMAEGLADDGLVKDALLALANCQMSADGAAAHASLRRCWDLGEQTGDEWTLARCALFLAHVGWYRQDLEDQRRWTAGAEERLARLGDRSTHAYMLVAQCGIRYPRAELADAVPELRASAALAREVSDAIAETGGRMLFVLAACSAGRTAEAREEIEAVRDHVIAMGGSVALIWVSLISAIASAADGDADTATDRLRPIVEGEIGLCRMPQIWARVELAELLRVQGDHRAGDHAAAALAEADAFGNPWLAARARTMLGRLAAGEDRWEAADDLLHQALEAITEHGLQLELPVVLEALAEVAAVRRGAPQAARLLAAAGRIRAERSLVAGPAQRAEVEALAVRVGPGDEHATADVDEVVAWVRRARGPRGRPARGWESLTPTEHEVVRHVADGCANPEIAARMFISRNTVKTHLAHIFAKLDLTSRTELAAMAARRLD